MSKQSCHCRFGESLLQCNLDNMCNKKYKVCKDDTKSCFTGNGNCENLLRGNNFTVQCKVNSINCCFGGNYGSSERNTTSRSNTTEAQQNENLERAANKPDQLQITSVEGIPLIVFGCLVLVTILVGITTFVVKRDRNKRRNFYELKRRFRNNPLVNTIHMKSTTNEGHQMVSEPTITNRNLLKEAKKSPPANTDFSLSRSTSIMIDSSNCTGPIQHQNTNTQP